MNKTCQWFSLSQQLCAFPFTTGQKLPFWAEDGSSARMLCAASDPKACGAYIAGDGIDDMQIFTFDREAYTAITSEGMRSSVTLEQQQQNQESESTTMAGNEERNGVKRPNTGTTGGTIWEAADRISAEKSAGKPDAIPATKDEVVAACPGVKPSTVSVEFSKWSKFYGLPPRRVSKPRSSSTATAPAAQPRINPQPPYQEGDVVNGYQLRGNAWQPYTPPAPPAPPPAPPAPPAVPPPSAPSIVPAFAAAPPPPAAPQPTTAQVQKQPPQQAPRMWKKGDVVNGHLFDGDNWVPIPMQKQPPAAPPAPPPVAAVPALPVAPPPPPPAPVVAALPPPPPAPLTPPPPAPPAPPQYKIGDRANGFVLTASGWVPDTQQPPAPPAAPWAQQGPTIEVVGEEP